MSAVSGTPNTGGAGRRQQRAAELRAEMERLANRDPSTTTAPATGGDSTSQGSSEAAPDQPPEHADTTDNEPVLAGEPPEGGTKHVVYGHDCMNSIAEQYGFHWRTLWDDPNNSTLKSKRQDPDVLLPGDEVIIPPLRRKDEAGATETEHPFKRKANPARLIMQFLEEDEPRANEPYRLEVDGDLRDGTTDGEGKIDEPIPGNARRAVLTLGIGVKEKTYRIELGKLDPYNTVRGVQSRLRNLGYDVGRVDGRIGPITRRAVRAFQSKHELPETGDLDEATCTKLREVHGS